MAGNYKKPEDIFFIISAVSEVLSVSNEPQQLRDMVLDTLLEVLKIDCCWVQSLNLESRKLWLAAHRGFTPDMEREIGSMDLGQNFGNQVAGLGHKIVIPDLSQDTEYGLTSFSKAGLRSLVAVPIRTYRTQGVMGIASRAKRQFPAEMSELLTVIASLVGVALDKADLFQRILALEKQLSTGIRLSVASHPGDGDVNQDLAADLKEAVEEWTMATGEAEKAVEQIARLMPPSQVDCFELQSHGAKEPEKGRIADKITDKIKVFVVDRDLFFYEGLCLYLSQTTDIEVIGKSEDFVEDTVLMIEELEPNVVLVDTNLPSTSGLDLARQITERSPSIPVIMLTPYENDSQILAALKAGVAGYLSKDIAGEGLADAIRRVSTGNHIINNLLIRPGVAQRVLSQFQGTAKTTEGLTAALSPEEAEILDCFAQGYSRNQVTPAMAMGNAITEDTLAAIVSKLIALS